MLIFKNDKSNVAVEIHGWSVAVASEVLPLVDYEILAMSCYVQAHKSK
ncbi:hypothetical protein ACFLSV_07860 [Bacteroidota bacterium]